MRILMINKYLYPRGGAETYMLGLGEGLKKHGHEVAFFGMEHPENINGDHVYSTPWMEMGSGQSKVQMGITLGRAILNRGDTQKRLDQAVDAFKPDLIHGHNVYHQLDPALTLNYTLPRVMTAHDYKAVCSNYQLYRDGAPCEDCLGHGPRTALGRDCIHGSRWKTAATAMEDDHHYRHHTYEKAYDQIIAPSQFMKDILVQGGIPDGMIQVIHNFARMETRYITVGQGLLYVGRLTQPKGIQNLLEAYALMDSPKPRLTIIGDGPEKERLVSRAKTLGVDSDIDWLGRISPESVRERMLEAAAVIVPSIWYENCSMTILESLSRGRMVIASDRGGNPELVRHGLNGWVYPADDQQALSKCLSMVSGLDGMAKALGQRAYQDARHRFSFEYHLSQVLSVYETLIRRQVAA